MAIELEDGTVILSLPEQVEENKAKVEEVDIKVDNLAARVEAALAGVLHYKGSVATYGDLPADAEIGDVYNVIDTGANYAWTGSEWDELGSVVDLSNCVTLDSAQTITADKTFNNANVEFVITDSLSYQLGKDSGYFSIARNHVSQLLLGSFSAFLKGTFHPYQDNVYNLGGSSYRWADLYLSGKINKNASGYGLALPSTSGFTADSELVDSASSQTITGTKRFDSNIQLGPSIYNYLGLNLGAPFISSNTGSLSTNANIYPSSTGMKDLGSSTYKWKDLYLSGNITDGTNSVNVAEIGKKLLTITSQRHLTSGEAKKCVGGIQVVSDYYLNLGSGVLLKNPYITGIQVTATTIDITAVGLNTSNQMVIYRGRLTINTSDDTVAVIEGGIVSAILDDMANLITYAKAQGWIS